MKKLFITCLVVVLMGCGQQKEEHILIVGTTVNYPPYESYSEHGEMEGFDIDISQALGKKLGVDIVVKDIGLDALVIALQQKKIDCIISGMSITESRLQEMAMIPYQGDPVKELTLAFWNKTPENITSLEDIARTQNPIVAVMVGSYQEEYLSKVSGIDMKSLDGTAELIMDIQYGKSQAVLFEPHIAEMLKQQFPQLQLIPFQLPQEEWVLGNGIGIRKDNITLQQKVERAVQELKSEETIHTLEKKWFKEQR